MSAKTSIIGIVDRIAKIRQNALALAATGTDFWDRIDAAGDETYENIVKGADATTLDTQFETGAVLGKPFTALINLLNTYFTQGLSLSSSGPLAAYLTSIGQRVSWDFAELLVDTLGEYARLAAQYVFPKGTRPADLGNPATSGMHLITTLSATTGTTTGTAPTALPTTVGSAAIVLINGTATTSVTDLVLTATRLDATTVDITAVLGAATQYKQSLLGAGAIDAAAAAAGQNVIPVKVSTAQFKAGEWVLIRKADNSAEEVAQVDSVASGSITLETNLVNAWAENDQVVPMFMSAAYKSGSVTDDKSIGVYAFPDRIIAL